MPRRKVTVLDRVELPTASGQIQSAIVTCLNELPPETYLLTAETPDQKQLWRGAKRECRLVGTIIDSYFSGDSPPTLSQLEKYQKENIWNTAWRYLSFYSMVWANWETVEKALCGKATPPMPRIVGNGVSFSPTGKAFRSLDTPLAVLLEVIRYRAIAIMANAFVPARDYIPNQIRRKVENGRKIRRADADEPLKEKVRADISDWIKERPYDWLEQQCALVVAKSNPRGVQKKALQSYLECCQERQALALKTNHRRNKPSRKVWRRGKLTENVRN